MITRSFVPRTTRSIRRPTATHRFMVGQAVLFRSTLGKLQMTAEICRITGTLPADGGSLQYRIRNDEERHERVTTEDSLEPADLSPAGEGATLIERTFGSARPHV